MIVRPSKIGSIHTGCRNLNAITLDILKSFHLNFHKLINSFAVSLLSQLMISLNITFMKKKLPQPQPWPSQQPLAYSRQTPSTCSNSCHLTHWWKLAGSLWIFFPKVFHLLVYILPIMVAKLSEDRTFQSFANRVS